MSYTFNREADPIFAVTSEIIFSTGTTIRKFSIPLEAKAYLKQLRLILVALDFRNDFTFNLVKSMRKILTQILSSCTGWHTCINI